MPLCHVANIISSYCPRGLPILPCRNVQTACRAIINPHYTEKAYRAQILYFTHRYPTEARDVGA